jgi:hypothetical protein
MTIHCLSGQAYQSHSQPIPILLSLVAPELKHKWRVAHIWLTVACRRYYNNWGCPTFRAFRKVGLPTARRLLIYFEGTDVLGAGVPRSNPSVLRSSSMSGQ